MYSSAAVKQGGPFQNQFKVESLRQAGMSKELKTLNSIPSDALMELDQQSSPTRCYIQVYEKKQGNKKRYFEEQL